MDTDQGAVTDEGARSAPARPRRGVDRALLRRYRGLGLVVAVALVARIVYWVRYTPDYVPISDAGQYHELATNIAEGRGFTLVFPQIFPHQTAFRPPLYPYLLGSWYRIFGTDVASGRVLSLLLGLAVVALTWLLLRKLAGARAGLVGALVVALYPPLLANDTALLTEPLSLALLAGMLLALAHERWAIAGVVCGLLILSRPSAQFLLVVVALWVLWRLGWRRAAAFAAIAAIVVVPWVVRNWVVMGAPVLVTSNGFNAAAMYSPQARESDDFVDPVFDERFEDFRLAQFDEITWQQDLQDLAYTELRHHPGQVLTVMGRNAQAYFELDPSRNDTAEGFDGRNMQLRDRTLPLFYVVTVVGLFGLVVRIRQPVVLLIGGIALYFVLTSLVFVAPPRLRAPFDWCCCVGVGLAFAWGQARWAARRGRADAPARTEDPPIAVPEGAPVS